MGSNAFRPKVNGALGEGQVFNIHTNQWEELDAKEGYVAGHRALQRRAPLDEPKFRPAHLSTPSQAGAGGVGFYGGLVQEVGVPRLHPEVNTIHVCISNGRRAKERRIEELHCRSAVRRLATT